MNLILSHYNALAELQVSNSRRCITFICRDVSVTQLDQ